MNEDVICPLMSISAEDNFTPCQGDGCAWYVSPEFAPNGACRIPGHCAVRDIGDLSVLARAAFGR